MDLIDDIPNGANYDREFVNKIFAVLFTDKYLNKLINRGSQREQILAHLRGTKRYYTIKGICSYSVFNTHYNIFVIVSHNFSNSIV